VCVWLVKGGDKFVVGKKRTSERLEFIPNEGAAQAINRWSTGDGNHSLELVGEASGSKSYLKWGRWLVLGLKCNSRRVLLVP